MLLEYLQLLAASTNTKKRTEKEMLEIHGRYMEGMCVVQERVMEVCFKRAAL